MTTVKDILIAARSRISEPGTWVQGAYATTIKGKACYCIDGAILGLNKLYRTDRADVLNAIRFARYLAAYCAIGDTRGWDDEVALEGLHEWNDALGRTQAEVLAVLDDAITIATISAGG